MQIDKLKKIKRILMLGLDIHSELRNTVAMKLTF